METETGKLEHLEANRLLERLCTVYGFCLSPLWKARLTTCPPQSPAKYTDTLFRAEGLDPGTADRALYKSILSEVQIAFDLGNSLRPRPDAFQKHLSSD